MGRNLCYKTPPRARNASRLAPLSSRWPLPHCRRGVAEGVSGPSLLPFRLRLPEHGRGGIRVPDPACRPGLAGLGAVSPGRVHEGRVPASVRGMTGRFDIPPAGLNCRQGARGLHREAEGGVRTLLGQTTNPEFLP